MLQAKKLRIIELRKTEKNYLGLLFKSCGISCGEREIPKMITYDHNYKEDVRMYID